MTTYSPLYLSTMLQSALVPLVIALIVARGALAQAECTLTASGDDDGPAFAAAVRSCETTTVPAGTTLSVGSALNLTGLSNKHIVRTRTQKVDCEGSHKIVS